MWGIEFRSETSNSLICAVAQFQLRKYGESYREMRVRWHPDFGIAIDENKSGEFECIKNYAKPEDVEAILPKKNDFGHDWTYSDFMLAMTFFSEGYKLGKNKGYYSGLKMGRQEKD